MDEIFSFIEPLWDEISLFLIGMGTGLSLNSIIEDTNENRRDKYLRLFALLIIAVLVGLIIWS